MLYFALIEYLTCLFDIKWLPLAKIINLGAPFPIFGTFWVLFHHSLVEQLSFNLVTQSMKAYDHSLPPSPPTKIAPIRVIPFSLEDWNYAYPYDSYTAHPNNKSGLNSEFQLAHKNDDLLRYNAAETERRIYSPFSHQFVTIYIYICCWGDQ